MAFYNWDGASVENLILPRVESNLATRYESYISISNNSINYVRFQPLTFAANDFIGTGSIFTRLCGNTIKITF
jgi:hypothetical protein